MQMVEAQNKLLETLGFSATSPPDGTNRLRKRPSEDGDDSLIPPKKIPAVLDSLPPPMPPARSLSEIQVKNKMLAQLLAKEPAPPPVRPHVSPAIISATPQDRLPKLMPGSATARSMGAGNVEILKKRSFRLHIPALTGLEFLTFRSLLLPRPSPSTKGRK